jgi:hypothetical protein
VVGILTREDAQVACMCGVHLREQMTLRIVARTVHLRPRYTKTLSVVLFLYEDAHPPEDAQRTRTRFLCIFGAKTFYQE